jgi:hypothetical protein
MKYPYPEVSSLISPTFVGHQSFKARAEQPKDHLILQNKMLD